MPAFEEEETIEPIEEVVTVEEPAELVHDFQDNVTRTSTLDISALLANSEGYDWTVDYYSQVLGSGQLPMGQDMASDAVMQQYTKINELNIKASAPLTSSLDENTNEHTITGTATLYTGVIPQIGDMLVALIGDGRYGVLELTSQRRLTHLKGSAYEVNYVVVDYATDERIEDLTSKVVKDLTFDKDRLASSSGGVLTTTEVASIRDTGELIEELTDEYLNRMYSESLESIMLPTDNIYDPQLARFCAAMLPASLTGDHIREIVLSFERLRYSTVLDWIYNGKATPYTSVTVMREAEPSEFTDTPELNGIRYTCVNKVIFPGGFPADSDWNAVVETVTEAVVQDVIDPLPLVIPVDDDDNYIFSYNFYNGHPCRSVLETVIRSFLNGDSVDPVLVKSIAEDRSNDWTNKDYLYYVPILIALLKTFDSEF